LPEVEDALRGKAVSAETFHAAAAVAGNGAKTTRQNAFKVTLLRRTVERALQMAAA
jgi:xanthine dehydrogenase YagS FAD-binding subunit